MEVPIDLDSWTIDLIRSLAATTAYEPGWFDFKGVLTGPGDIADSIRRVACAMANTAGGYIIFGVKDRAHRKEGEDPVIGLDLTKSPDLASQFGHLVQVIHQGISFESSPRPIHLESDKSRGVFVVHVQFSPLRPHEFEGRFLRRGDGGNCVPMQFYEVRDQMLLSEETIRKVRLLRLELKELIVTSNAMGEGNENLSFHRFDTGGLKILIADTCSVLPPGGNLITQLLAIVRFARHSNEALDRLNQHYLQNWAVDSPSPSRGEGAGSRRAQLHGIVEADRTKVVRLCEECETTLLNRFGDLSSAST